jgi:la-related protein 1
MSDTTSKSAASATPLFSYAQAAKGKSANTSSNSQSLKDEVTTNGTMSNDGINTQSPEDGTKLTNGHADSTTKSGLSPSQNATQLPHFSAPSSPSFGTASTTLTKDHDVSSTPATSSESTWDMVSQASSGEKGSDSTAVGKDGKKDKGEEKKAKEQKPQYVAAPPPQVNIWAMRKESLALKATPVSQSSNNQATPSDAHARVETNGKADKTIEPRTDQRKKGPRVGTNGDENDRGPAKLQKEKRKGANEKPRDDGMWMNWPNEFIEINFQTGSKRNGPFNKSPDSHKEKAPSAPSAPPPVDDAISWPTPETAKEEEQRKAREPKNDKSPSVGASRGKDKFVAMPFVPTVNFNTPLPPRRGGPNGRTGAPRGDRPRRNSTGVESTSAADRKVSDAGPQSGNNSTTQNLERGRGGPNSSRENGQVSHRQPKSSGSTGQNVSKEHRNTAPSNTEAVKEVETKEPGAMGPPELTSRRTSNATQTEQDDFQGSRRNSSHSRIAAANAGGNDYGTAAGAENHHQSRGSISERRGGYLGKSRVDYSEGGFGGSFAAREQRGRPDRGRGAYRGSRGGNPNFANGQPHVSQPYMNGSHSRPAHHQSNPSFGATSPVAFTPQQQFAATPPWAMQAQPNYGSPRSNSNAGMPNGAPVNGNGAYGRYQTHPQLGFIQTQMSPQSEYPATPVSAYSPMPFDPYVIIPAINQQLDFYFSVENLIKDTHLRKHMDSQGYVFLSLLTNFPRMKFLTTDYGMVRDVCIHHKAIEILHLPDGSDKVRAASNWAQWVLPMADRDPAAQNEGPTFQRPPPYYEQQHMMQNGTSQSPSEMAPNGFGGHDPNYGYHLHGVAPAFVPGNGFPTNGYTNGDHENHSALSANVPAFSPSDNNVAEPSTGTDSFPDEKIATLRIVTVRKPASRKSSAPLPYHRQLASRTFSNGSIDQRTFSNEPPAASNGSTDT